MAFRADEDREKLLKEAIDYFIGPEIDRKDREESSFRFKQLISHHGPVVQAYPSWHPIVLAGNIHRQRHTSPSDVMAFRGLDHTRLLRDGFITCPYDDGEAIFKSVEEIQGKSDFLIDAERLDFKLYHPDATPIFVRCDWEKGMNPDGTIPQRLAVPLMLEFELPNWRSSQVAETWETMRPYLMGQPCGSRSSLFVNQETGMTMKKVWNSLIFSGMFGSIMVGR